MKKALILTPILIFTLALSSFATEFQHINTIGGFGSSKGLFKKPTAITGDSQNLFICDTGNNRIIKFNLYANTFDQFSALPDNLDKLDQPIEILLHQNNTIFISDTRNQRIIAYSYQGQYKYSFGNLGLGNNEFDTPIGLAQNLNGTLAIADSQNNRLQLFSTSQLSSLTGPSVTKILENESLINPGYLCATRTNNFLVSSSYDHSLKLFDSFGNLLKTFFNPGFLKDPKAISEDSDGNYYLADSGHGQVLYFNPQGEILGTISTPLVSPYGIFTQGNLIYISDKSLHQIVVFKKI